MGEQDEKKERLEESQGTREVLHESDENEEVGRAFTDEELEALFEAADEEEMPPPFFQRPWFRKLMGTVLVFALSAQVVALIPQMFSLPAVRFLRVSAQLSQSEDIQRYKQSVVVIRTEESKGTGFLIAASGLIVTNRHVVEGALAPKVHFLNGDVYAAQVLAMEEDVDLALLGIGGTHEPTLTLAESYDGSVGMPVYIIGNPLMFNGIANQGETLGLMGERNPPIMALQAPVYRGNSGSPVINRDGEVIGVVYATSVVEQDGERLDIGLAVPVDWVWRMLAQVP